MKTNVKPGDLAIVVRARNPENIGKIILVVRQAHPGERNPLPNGRLARFKPYNPSEAPFWYCEAQGAGLLITINGAPGLNPWAIFRDSVLRPLRDDSEDDAVHTNDQLKETA